MARPIKKLKSKEPEETEMSGLETGRKVRFGIGLKFALPVTLALSLVIIVLGLVVYDAMASSLESQVNAQGVFAAKIAAAPEIDSWESDYNTRQDLIRRLAAIEAELEVAGTALDSTANAPAIDPNNPDQKKIIDRIKGYEDAQQKFNRARLRQLLGSQGALDVWVVKGAKDLRVSAAGGKASYVPRQELRLRSAPDTKIIIGDYDRGSGEFEPARFFQHPIVDRNGQRRGAATVVVSEKQLRADLRALRNQIIAFCIIGLLAGVLVSWLTSRVVSQPIHALLKDIRAVAQGNLEHRTRARSADEIGNLALTFDHMTRNLAQAEVMRVEHAEQKHQVSIAHEVQERLFPRVLPELPGLHLEATNRLAGELSSDLFDAVELDGGRVGCLVMTASGRGLPAAIVLSMARAIFRTRGMAHASPADALREVNRFLAPDLRRGMYVSAIYAILDPATGEGHLASAGHRVPGLHFVKAKGGLRKVQADGIAMGLDEGPVFDRSLTEVAVTLEEGDRLLLATEGAFLLAGPDGEALGESEFQRVVLGMCKRNGSPSAILATFAERLGEEPGAHDLTLVTATRR